MLDMSSIAFEGLIQIILSIIFIALSWWVLQVVRWDIFLLKPNSAQGKLLLILLSILMGAGIAQFFTQYLGWSTLMKYMF